MVIARFASLAELLEALSGNVLPELPRHACVRAPATVFLRLSDIEAGALRDCLRAHGLSIAAALRDTGPVELVVDDELPMPVRPAHSQTAPPLP